MYYRIVEPEDLYAAQILHDTLDWLKSDERMQRDYEKLTQVCTSPDVPIIITRAPKPNTLQKANTTFERHEEIETYLL